MSLRRKKEKNKKKRTSVFGKRSSNSSSLDEGRRRSSSGAMTIAVGSGERTSPRTVRVAQAPLPAQKLTPLVHFGCADAEKHHHVILRFNLADRVLEYMVPEKHVSFSTSFNDMSAPEFDEREREIQLNTFDDPDHSKFRLLQCYNEFDFGAIQGLLSKVMSKADDLEEFADALKPQLCFLRTFVSGKRRKAPSLTAVLVERQLILLPKNSESSEETVRPTMLIPLYKRPCFTIQKTCIRFDLSGTFVEIFFQSTEERDQWYEAITVASSKTPKEIIPLRKKLVNLVELNHEVFSLANPSHVEFLRRLWDATIGVMREGEKLPTHALSDRWKDLGFSDVNPSRDFGVCNMLGLVAGVYFAENYPRAFLQIVKSQASGTDSCFPVMPVLAKISFMVMQLLELTLSRNAWYPTFSAFPLFTFDPFAFETLVCISLQLFSRMWEGDELKKSDTSRCMSNLLMQLTSQVKRPASEGVPYIYEMFAVLLGDKKNTAALSYTLMSKGDSAMLLELQSNKEEVEDSAARVYAWSFADEKLLEEWKAGDATARAIMLAPMETDGKVLSREEQRKLKEDTRRVDQRWAKLMDQQNAFLDKLRCRLCEKRKADVVCLPCRHPSVCSFCFAEGMKCPMASCSYTTGFLVVKLAQSKVMMTLR